MNKAIKLTVVSFPDSLESFGLTETFVNLPLFFLSGTLFRVTNIPSWLQLAVYLNHRIYGVDALHAVILGAAWTPIRPRHQEALILLAFDAIMILMETVAFARWS